MKKKKKNKNKKKRIEVFPTFTDIYMGNKLTNRIGISGIIKF